MAITNYRRWPKRIFTLGYFISDKVKQHDAKKKQQDIVYKSLDGDQKKEVDEGNYDPYNFEEDELEDDDYYSEDE